MKSEVEKVIEKGLKDYTSRTIRISDKEYPLFVFLEDEDLNLFEGFVVAKVEDKSELSALRKYRPPVSGYVARFSIIFYKDQLLIEDYRRNKSIRKTLSKINKTFIRKLKKALTEPKEENFNKLFDRSDVIEEFYILYKKSRDYLLTNIKGISDDEKREEFVDNFMMQMLTLWYLQERGFFNGDKSYFITKFKEMAQKKLVGGFNSYYDFLTNFFEKISDYSDEQYYEDKTFGKVVVVGPAVFINGEHSAEAISIPDKCFYKEGMTEILINTPPKKVSADVPLLNLFESRDWTEGNIDEFVLGSIYEKLITYMERKKLGAYYTPEEITSYICKNTIEPYLVDWINDKFGGSFESIDEIIEASNREMLLYLFEQLKDIKILDPAVGSAHFLESAINVLIDIYEKVWEKAKELKINKLEIIASDEKGRIKKINLLDISSEERLKLYVKFFIILSRNIYGVDINPSALKVARARLFLTLAKHFRVGKERDIFIRFPNVHFNLRGGNSLIGYVELERERQEGQLVLDLFVREDRAPYRLELIKKHLQPIEDYLVQAARSLGIEGDIAKEVKELDDILSKDKITWRDFEKVLRTKEKLIKILIASLNSSYAKPLNELLNRITELFNNRLDEKFAEEHGIKLEDLKQIKTFHWIFEFPEVFLRENPGFDVVIGNPPYVMEVREHKKIFRLYKKTPIGKKYYEQKMDIFYFFIEQGIDLLRNCGLLGFIVQEYWVSREFARKLRIKIFSETTPKTFIFFREFNIFKDAPGQHNMILILEKNKPQNGDITKIMILKDDIFDEASVYNGMYGDTNIFSVNVCETIYLYDSNKDMVSLSDINRKIFNVIENNVFYLNSKEVQQGIVTPQHYLTQKAISKLPNPSEYRVNEGIFVLSEEEFSMVDWDKNEKNIFKPFHFAEELDRFHYTPENKYFLIYTTKDIAIDIEKNPDKYPHVKKHLDRFQPVITSDHKPYGLHRPRQPEWFEDPNKIMGVRKTKYPKFVVVPIPYYVDQSVIIIRLVIHSEYNPQYICSLLNSKLGHWIFYNIKRQGKQLQIDKSVLLRFPIKKADSNWQNTLSIISRYINFLKQYHNYIKPKDLHITYIIEYFDNLIDCLVYELYLGDVVEIGIKPLVKDKLRDLDTPVNLLEASDEEVEDILKQIIEVYESLESDTKLKENLFLIKLHPWVKQIYEALG